jgi:D-alanine-D-alanine ligase-like ATP-grasp enzyme
MWERVLGALGRLPWRPARDLAAAVEVLRAAGPGSTWRHRRERAAWARVAGGARDSAYLTIWTNAAAELGAEAERLSDGSLELRMDGATARVRGEFQTLDPEDAVQLAFDKPRVQRLLLEEGLPVPDHLETHFGDLDPALRFLERADGPCVVKPARRTGAGHGVTTGIRTRSELVRASVRASRNDPQLLIERQAPGDMYRLLFLDGELLDVVRRLPPRVTGDGESAIADLIAKENARRLEGRGRLGLHLIGIDLDCVLALERQGLRLSSVPPAGSIVTVKAVVSQNGPRDNETVREPISEELVGSAAAAVDVVGLRVAGVDVVTPDLSRAFAGSGGVILEVNGRPGLHHHYHVANPPGATPVAVPILRELLARRE